MSAPGREGRAPNPIERFTALLFKAVEAFLALLLALMVVMVFGNVVLRYAFDSGIIISEELARFLFVWVTFLGAVVVFHQRGHLGMTMVVEALPPALRRLCLIVSDLLIVACALMFLKGAWQQTLLNLENVAPISNLPLAWVYGSGVVSSVGIALLAAANALTTIVTGRTELLSSGNLEP